MSEWKEYFLEELLLQKPDYGANAAAISFNPQLPRFLRITDIDENGRIKKDDIVSVERKYLEQYDLQNDDIVIARTGNTVGKSYIYHTNDGSLVFAGYLIRFRFDKRKAIPNFLFHYFNSGAYKTWIKNTLRTGAQPNINANEYSSIRLKIPSTEKQTRIAHILSTCDAVIEKTAAAIVKYKAIKQGMLNDLFTRGIEVATGKLRPRQENAPELYKQSKLGWIPREWEVERLEKLCSMKSGEGITSRNIQNMGAYRVFGGNGLRGFTSIYTHEGEYTLIGRQGALCGNITRVSGRFYASEHAVVVTVEKRISVDWLSQKIDTMNLNQYSEASAQPGLSVSKIQKLLVVKPEFDEQKLVAQRLLTTDNEIQTEQDYLQKLQQLKQGLMSDLLSGKKQVNVNVHANTQAAAI